MRQYRNTARLISTSILISMLSACTPKALKQPDIAQQQDLLIDSNDIHNLLIANVAYHQNEDEVALQALATVASRSQNVRLLEDALLLAYRLDNTELMQSLNSTLLEVDPKNRYARINRAYQSFQASKLEEGIDNLITYLSHLEETNPESIRSATALILSQDRDTQDSILYELTHTENVNTYLTAAIIYGLNQRDDLHLQLLDDTLELKPELEYPAILKLDHYLKDNNIDAQTLTRFTRKHLKKNPKHTRFRMLYSSYLIDTRAYKAAIKQLKQVVKHEPDNASAYYILGLTYIQNNQNEKAIPAFKQSIDIDPSNEQSHFYLADAYESLEQYNNAINALNNVSSDEGYFEAQMRIGLLLGQHQSLNEGIAWLNNIETHSHNEKINIIIAQEKLYRENRAWQQALRLLDNGLAQFPDNQDLLYKRGYIHAIVGNIAEHEKDMRSILALDPQNSDALNALGYTLADQTDRYDEALELILKANNLSPQSPYILDSLGWVYYRLGELNKALEYLLEAYGIMQDAEIATHIGEVYWQLDDKQKAKQYWQEAAALDPQNKNLIKTRERLLETP